MLLFLVYLQDLALLLQLMIDVLEFYKEISFTAPECCLLLVLLLFQVILIGEAFSPFLLYPKLSSIETTFLTTSVFAADFYKSAGKFQFATATHNVYCSAAYFFLISLHIILSLRLPFELALTMWHCQSCELCSSFFLLLFDPHLFSVSPFSVCRFGISHDSLQMWKIATHWPPSNGNF